jgi:hypothetical protein
LFLLTVESGDRRRLTSAPEKVIGDRSPAFSPDGGTLAFVRQVAMGVLDIYLLTLSKDIQPIGEPKRLTFENQVSWSPVWTLDGREIVFASGPWKQPNLFRIAASGSGKPQRLASIGEDGSEAAISHRTQRGFTPNSATRTSGASKSPVPMERSSSPMKLIYSTRDVDAQFSPDGKVAVRIAPEATKSGCAI